MLFSWWSASPAEATEIIQNLELRGSAREVRVAPDLRTLSAASEVGFSGMETYGNSGSLFGE